MRAAPKIGKVIAGILCLILAVFMTAEVAHGHANATDASHCQLCASAHLATDVHPVWLAPVTAVLLGLIYLGEPSPGARAVLVTAFIRPPPASF